MSELIITKENLPLAELQIAWLQMDRTHQEWGCSAYAGSSIGEKEVTLEMPNENFGINIDIDYSCNISTAMLGTLPLVQFGQNPLYGGN